MLDELQRVRWIQRADVYKRGELAGWLERTPEGVRFDYDPDYLASGGPPVATSLPPSKAPTVASAGAVPPFFAGLLPEGRRLLALRRAVKTSADDELSLLLAVGADAVGDVQIIPAGEPPDRPAPHVAVADWSNVRFADLMATSPEAYLSANGDLHAKNLSVHEQADGEWRLSPAYDMPSTHPYGDTTMALPVDERTRDDITRDNFVALGAHAGVTHRAIVKTLDRLCERVDLWIDDLDRIPLPERRIRELRRVIDGRRRQLAG